MMPLLNAALAAALAASLLMPQAAAAKPADGKRDLKIVVRPKAPPRSSKYGPYGFLPGYRQPPPLAEWRDRAPRYGGGDFSADRRYISGSEWRYGWGYPQFYRGRWNGGGFGPCWTNTPIGPMWNCGM
jgi:hypothetical protein